MAGSGISTKRREDMKHDFLIIDDPLAETPHEYKASAEYKEMFMKWDEVLKSRIDSDHDPLPDYSVEPSTHHLFDQLERFPRTKNPKRAFFQGCLAVLKLLGEPETRSEEDTVKLARVLTHEARHFLGSEQ
jgi:hypothetical protein